MCSVILRYHFPSPPFFPSLPYSLSPSLSPSSLSHPSWGTCFENAQKSRIWVSLLYLKLFSCLTHFSLAGGYLTQLNSYGFRDMNLLYYKVYGDKLVDIAQHWKQHLFSTSEIKSIKVSNTNTLFPFVYVNISDVLNVWESQFFYLQNLTMRL